MKNSGSRTLVRTSNFFELPKPDTKTRVFELELSSDPCLILRENNELDVYIGNAREWTEGEKRQLRKSVRDDALRERMRSLMEAKDSLVEQGRAKGVAEERRAEIMGQIRELKAKHDEVVAMPDSELFHNREEDFDWMRISAQTVGTTLYRFTCDI